MNLPQSKYPKTYDIEFLDIILNDVSRETGIPVETMCSTDRHDNVVIAKKMYMTLAKTFVKTDLGTIGENINKTHSNVIYGLKTFKDIYHTDVKVRHTHDLLMKNLDLKRNFQREGLYRCETCGGTKVKTLAMIDINTGKKEELDSKYCMDCKCETKIKKIDIVGWSRWSAREVHILEVEGSNPSPATRKFELC